MFVSLKYLKVQTSGRIFKENESATDGDLPGSLLKRLFPVKARSGERECEFPSPGFSVRVEDGCKRGKRQRKRYIEFVPQTE